MGYNLAKQKMKKKLLLSIGILCCLTAVFVVNSAFTTKNEIVISVDASSSQSGSIPVYKYKFASSQKEQIGEIYWSATTEKDSNYKWGEFSKVSLSLRNTTNEYIKVSFSYQGGTGSISAEVRPRDTWETTEICSASVTGVNPIQDKITL